MASKTALKQRIDAAEEAAGIDQKAPTGALPVIVEADALNGRKARALRRQRCEVMTFEQCVEVML